MPHADSLIQCADAQEKRAQIELKSFKIQEESECKGDIYKMQYTGFKAEERPVALQSYR